MYLDRLLDRIKEEKGITFEEFRVFCQFLNNLEDFAIAMRMYTLADHPISKGGCTQFFVFAYHQADIHSVYNFLFLQISAEHMGIMH
jgi:hypothetical protein